MMDVPIHINRPSSTRYVALAKGRGCRNWVTLQSSRSKRRAIRAVSEALAKAIYFRGAVMLAADWYDPVCIYEARLR